MNTEGYNPEFVFTVQNCSGILDFENSNFVYIPP